MNISASIRLSILALLAFVSVSAAQTVRERLQDPDFKLYTVIFGLAVGTDSKLQSFRVVEVTDLKSGSTAAVDVPVPQAYIDAVQKKLEAKKYQPNFKDGKAVEFFTYFYYTRKLPTTVITDLDHALDKQP